MKADIMCLRMKANRKALHTCKLQYVVQLMIKLVATHTHTNIIGASLSEPHTSGTALRKCVCNVLVCLRPYTVILNAR